MLDFWKRVPPGSSGQRRAMRHGLANAVALLLFAFAVWLRRHGVVTSGALLLELFGAMIQGPQGDSQTNGFTVLPTGWIANVGSSCTSSG